MWLINTNTLKLENFIDERQTDYAILSHRWTEEELTFQKFSSDDPKVISAVRQMKGFSKIEQCCRQALSDGFQYAWVDTCCIDKSSSAELQEAINSMFSQWFTRGWTLQELIAPQDMVFFDIHWRRLGSRGDLATSIEAVCGVPVKSFANQWISLRRPRIALIMSWASGRVTSRVEDRAYSLLGLFDVNMPLLYGEGEKAFQRLQEEIFKCTEDQTIFAWEGVTKGLPSLFARSPDQFLKKHHHSGPSDEIDRRKPHMVTNEGILFETALLLIRPRTYLAPLYYDYRIEDRVCIILKQLDEEDRYARIPGSMLHSSLGDLVHQSMFVGSKIHESVKQRMISVVRTMTSKEKKRYYSNAPLAFEAHLPSDLALRPYIGDGYVSHYGNTSLPDQRRQLMEFVEGECMRREFDRSESRPNFIQCGQYSRGPVAIMESISHAIRYALLGFDEDFLPVCILSTCLLAEQTFTQRNLSTLFESCRPASRRHESHYWHGLHNKASQTSGLKVIAVGCGNHKDLSPGVVAIFADEQVHGTIRGGYHATIEASIIVEPFLAIHEKDHRWKLGRGSASKRREAVQELTLRISGSERSPWKVTLEVREIGGY